MLSPRFFMKSIIVMLVLTTAVPAAAEVLESTPNGFAVRNTVRIAAHPSRVYNAAVDLVGRWWSPAHTFSKNAANLTLDARPGGCLCEHITNGGVMHLTVIYVAMQQEIRFTGALGPLQRLKRFIETGRPE